MPQSPDARLSWAFVVRGFISIISKVKMQENIQRDWNSMTLTFTLTFCGRGRWRRRRRRGYSNSSSALKCRRAKNLNFYVSSKEADMSQSAEDVINPLTIRGTPAHGLLTVGLEPATFWLCVLHPTSYARSSLIREFSSIRELSIWGHLAIFINYTNSWENRLTNNWHWVCMTNHNCELTEMQNLIKTSADEL